jgi:hypothetical protein
MAPKMLTILNRAKMCQLALAALLITLPVVSAPQAGAFEPGQEVRATVFCFDLLPVMEFAELTAVGERAQANASIQAYTVAGDCVWVNVPVPVTLDRVLRPAGKGFDADIWSGLWRGVPVYMTAPGHDGI